jgi:hypothetical protein
MKKVLVCFIIALFSMPPAFAEFNIRTISGYTHISLENINNYINRAYNAAKADNITDLSKQGMGNAWFVGLDGGYTIIPGLSIGPRVEYIGAFPGHMQGVSNSLSTTASVDFSAALIPIMGGVSYTLKMPDSPFSFGAEAYAGYGFADFSMDGTASNGYAGATSSEPFDGGCLVIDSDLKFAYEFTNIFSACLNIGYRAANAPKITYKRIGFTIPVPYFSDIDKDMHLDFSGFASSLSLAFSF